MCLKFGIHLSASIVRLQYPKKAPSTALASKLTVFQGSDVEVEENVVAPTKHPVVSDGVKDLFHIFVRFDICPRGQG